LADAFLLQGGLTRFYYLGSAAQWAIWPMRLDSETGICLTEQTTPLSSFEKLLVEDKTT
jgi:hypothetical protein